MILQALNEYYERKGNDLPPVGWLKKGIDFSILLHPDGRFHQIECLQEIKKNKTIPFPSVAPSIGKQAVKHTNSGTDANLLWDNSAFVLGIGKNATEKRASFINAIHQWLGDIKDDGVSTVLAFYSLVEAKPEIIRSILQNPDYGEILQSGNPVISFRIVGESSFVYERAAIRMAISRNWGRLTENSGVGICLLTGKEENIETCHVVTKGVWGSQPSGATIIGFNKPAFESFGKDQGLNAPVGKTAAFAYTTALNHLLEKDTGQRLQVGDSSTVFWAEKPSDLELSIVDIFEESKKDNPDAGVKAVESLYKSVHSGVLAVDDGPTRFFVLGLAPNASRIAIRFWIVSTVLEMSQRIVQHFEDLKIVHGPHDPETLSISSLLISTSPQRKPENISPGLAGDVMRAILDGQSYPRTILESAIRRTHAEQSVKDKKTGKSLLNVPYNRASLIKACLNRNIRLGKSRLKEELKVSLDPENRSIGYLLGRLFAELERLQIRVHTQGGGKPPNSTIRDRFYGAASSVPVSVFSTLIRLSKHHLSKLENIGERKNFEKRIGEIVNGLPARFPSHLELDHQGSFAIGYYHQIQSSYVKNEISSVSPQTSTEGKY